MIDNSIKGFFILLFISIIWGLAFVFQKDATSIMNAFAFNSLRFSVAILGLLPLFLLPKTIFCAKGKRKYNKKYNSYLKSGIIAGLFMFMGITLQQAGLEYTTAGKSGFITALYIIIVPFLAIFIGQRLYLKQLVACVLAIVGFYFLGLGGVGLESSLNFGDFLCLLSAFFWALQITWLSSVAKYDNILHVAFIQVVVVAVLSIITVVIQNIIWQIAIPTTEDIILVRNAVIYTGVFSTSIAFTLQILGQRMLDVTTAALIISLESVFALIFGILFLNEVITLPIFIGCMLIFLGIIIVQLKPKTVVRIKEMIVNNKLFNS